MTDISKLFPSLLDEMWGSLTKLSPDLGMSVPNSEIIQLYGPLTSKIEKDASVHQGQKFYDKYLRGKNGTYEWNKISELKLKIRSLATQASNGTVGSSFALQKQQEYCNKAYEEVVEKLGDGEDTQVRLSILAAADLMIVQSLSFIPIAGPIIAASLSVATTAVASGVTKSSNSSAGIATLCSLGYQKLSAATDNSITQASRMKNKSFLNMHKYLSQNQIATSLIGKKIYSGDSKQIIKKIINKNNDAISDAARINAENKDSIKSFKDKSDENFEDARELLVSLINASIIPSFEEYTDRFNILKDNDDKELRLALLVIGYFRAKDWNNVRDLDNEDYSENKSSSEGSSSGYNIGRSHSLRALDPKSNRIGPSARSILQNSIYDLSKRTMIKDGSDKRGSFESEIAKREHMLSTYIQRSSSYLDNVKKSIAADVETVIRLSASGRSMSKSDYTQMWSLYIGSMMIVNHVLERQKFGTKIAAPDLPENYVNMIQSAGFIIRYKTYVGIVTESSKYKYAQSGKIRYAAHPSDNEITMVVIFCVIVIYTVNVGTLSLGYQSWKDVTLHLSNICKYISATRLSSSNANKLLAPIRRQLEEEEGEVI